MIIVGLTGGIGSGKSTILNYLKNNGYPCFESDKVAKKVFSDSKLLKNLNDTVHPAVHKAFVKFKNKHENFPMIIKEAAILIESGSYKSCDFIILVKAPRSERIKRIVARDSVNESDVIVRINNQWDDKKKEKYADYVIENINLDKTFEKVKILIEKLNNKKGIH